MLEHLSVESLLRGERLEIEEIALERESKLRPLAFFLRGAIG